MKSLNVSRKLVSYGTKAPNFGGARAFKNMRKYGVQRKAKASAERIGAKSNSSS